MTIERRPISIDGLTPDEVLSLPDEVMQGLILTSEPLVFRVGSAEILAQFWIADDSLILDLAQIDGGGEGVLPTLAALAKRFAIQRGLHALDWRVHALNCAVPISNCVASWNGAASFITDVPGTGPCYHRIESF